MRRLGTFTSHLSKVSFTFPISPARLERNVSSVRMASIDYDDRACIIVLEHRAGGNLSQVGAIVDAVDDVVVLGASQLAPPPDFVGAVEGRFLAGIATSTERVRAVLNMQEILASDVSFEIPDVNSLSADAGTGAS
jgi:hypothetical protein